MPNYYCAHAFAPPAVCSSCRVLGAGAAHTALPVSRTPNDPSFFTSFNDDENDDDADDDGDTSSSNGGHDVGNNRYAADPRTDVKSFLTQRSLQSLHHLLTATRDQVSADWLEMEFLGVEKGSQLAFHGTGAAYLHEQSEVDGCDGAISFGSWQELIVSLVEHEVITKRVGLGKKHKGGDGRRRMAANSYLEDLSSASSVVGISGEEGGVQGRSPDPSLELSKRTDGKTSELDRSNEKQTNKSHNLFGGSPPAAVAAAAAAATRTPQQRQAPRSATSSYLDSIGSSNSGGNGSPIDWSTMSSSSISSSTNSSDGSGPTSIASDAYISTGGSSTTTGIGSSTSKFPPSPVSRDQFQRSLLSMRLWMTSRRKEQFHRSLLSARFALDQKSTEADSSLSASSIRDASFDHPSNTNRAASLDYNAVAPSPSPSSFDSKQKVDIDRERLAQDRERGFQSNPHISSDDDEFYMDLDVDPKSLATRLLAVREQIALEFVEDLTLIWKADKTLLTDLMVWAEESGESRASDNGKEGVVSMPSSNAINMHHEILAYSSSGKASSSFRKGNMDLLYNLSTQAAIHRLLKQLMSDECNIDNKWRRADRASIRTYNKMCFRWLRDFYVARVGHFFDGDLPFGRADDFFKEWLQQSSFRILDETRTAPTSAGSGEALSNKNKVDPLRLAEEMVRIRSDIVMEWRKTCRLVPEEDHGWIKLLIMEKRAADDKSDPSRGSISGNIGLDDDFTDENGLGGFQ